MTRCHQSFRRTNAYPITAEGGKGIENPYGCGQFFDTPKTFFDASSTCTELGGILNEPYNDEHTQWTGYNDLANEGVYVDQWGHEESNGDSTFLPGNEF